MKKPAILVFCALGLLACDKEQISHSPANNSTRTETQFPLTWYPGLGFQFNNELTRDLKDRNDLQQRLKEKWSNPVTFNALTTDVEWDIILSGNEIEPKPVFARIQSCEDYFSTNLKDLELTTSNEQELYIYHWKRIGCIAIKAVIEGNSSNSSNIGKITLDKAFSKDLPIEMAFYISPEQERFVVKNKGKSWSFYNKIKAVVRVNDYESTYKLDGATQTMLILARGDFNDDNIEDLIILVDNSITDARYQSIRLFIITRDPGAKMYRVIKKF